MKKENKTNFEELENTEFLSDEMMSGIDAGGCTSCKKACQPGNQNSNVANGNTIQSKPADQAQKISNNTNALSPESTICIGAITK